MAVASTPFLYCNSSLLHDLLLTEGPVFENAGGVIPGTLFLGENQKCCVFSLCGTKEFQGHVLI